MTSLYQLAGAMVAIALLSACVAETEGAPATQAGKASKAEVNSAAAAAGAERFRTVSNGQIVLDDGTRLSFWADETKGVCETTKDSANVQYLMGNNGSRLSVTTSGGQLVPVVYDKSGKPIWELVEYNAALSGTVGITVMAQGIWSGPKGKKGKGKMVLTCR